MAIELSIFQPACPCVIPYSEITLINIFAKSCAASLHLLIKQRAFDRTSEDYVFHIRRVETCCEQINRSCDSRLVAPNFCEVSFKLSAVTLRSSDTRGKVFIA